MENLKLTENLKLMDNTRFEKFMDKTKKTREVLQNTPKNEGKLLFLNERSEAVVNDHLKQLNQPKIDDYTQNLINRIKVLWLDCFKPSYSMSSYQLTVCVEVDNNYWQRLKKHKQLGSLYGVDLGNLLNRVHGFNTYAIPIVDDKKRASKGVKTIVVRYNFDDIEVYNAMRLNLKK